LQDSHGGACSEAVPPSQAMFHLTEDEAYIGVSRPIRSGSGLLRLARHCVIRRRARTSPPGPAKPEPDLVNEERWRIGFSKIPTHPGGQFIFVYRAEGERQTGLRFAGSTVVLRKKEAKYWRGSRPGCGHCHATSGARPERLARFQPDGKLRARP